ncbi:hypothetical protein OAR33_00625 [bacterium]|nr:hypothetical protein [bacterium]MDB4633014.1 hypothetical protein [bacterium]MDC0992056.1 hypothetical protein [bacterium]
MWTNGQDLQTKDAKAANTDNEDEHRHLPEMDITNTEASVRRDSGGNEFEAAMQACR